MTAHIAAAENSLYEILEFMKQLLYLTSFDALPFNSLSNDMVVDTDILTHDRDIDLEKNRIAKLTSVLRNRFNRLRTILSGFGTVPISRLNEEIRSLHQRQLKLGEQMVVLYDEASLLATGIEKFLLNSQLSETSSDLSEI